MAIKVVHCITSLKPDGAQQMLLKVITSSDRDRFSWLVVNLGGAEKIGEQLETIGVEVVNLELNRKKNLFAGLLKFFRVLNSFKPDCIQGWMYHGNLLASGARFYSLVSLKRHTKKIPVVWNIRRGLDDFVQDKLLTRCIIKLGAFMSRQPSQIVYCAEICRTQHEAIGFDISRGYVIHNGFDHEHFRRHNEKRASFRRKLGIAENEPLVGIAGRYHAQKDFPTFLRAASLAGRRMPSLRFVMVGRGVDYENEELRNLAQELGIKEALLPIGQCQDMLAFYSALDVYCLSSVTEGFPNVVGEAMSVGVPCVVTNAGGAGEIVQGIGEVVKRRDPEALAEAMCRLLGKNTAERERIGQESRRRIKQEYSINECTKQYQQMYQRLCSGDRGIGGDQEMMLVKKIGGEQ